MKLVVRVAAILGFALLIVLIAREGAAAILTLIGQAGWALLWLVPLHVLPLLLDVLGWRVLIPGRPRVRSLVWIAAVREAINRLLPVANIGGEIVGIRMLASRGVPGTTAAGSVIIEVLLTLVSQLLFAVLGVLCLVRLIGALQVSGNLFLTVAAGIPVIVIVALLLRHASVFARLGRWIAAMLGPRVRSPAFLGQGADLDAAIRELSADPVRLAATIGWQVSGLLVGCLETWLALRWLGAQVGFTEAVVFESLTQAARSFIFVVPAGLGVQEATLVGIGHVLGLGSDVAIALSLAKRMREIVFGLPVLLAWQSVEGRRGVEQFRGRNEC